MLGVCLGHQSIGHATGAEIVRADRLMHGKTDHDPPRRPRACSPAWRTRFRPRAITAWSSSPARSATISRSAPGATPPTAARDHGHPPQDGCRCLGVQFHPESFLTHCGGGVAAEVSWSASLTMLTVAEALEKILATRPAARGNSRCATVDALGLVLAEDVASDIDSPPLRQVDRRWLRDSVGRSGRRRRAAECARRESRPVRCRQRRSSPGRPRGS